MTRKNLSYRLRDLIRPRHNRFARGSNRAAQKFALEPLEGRVTPAINSAVSAGVLTVTSTFDDPIVISASGGAVLINGANPGRGRPRPRRSRRSWRRAAPART